MKQADQVLDVTTVEGPRDDDRRSPSGLRPKVEGQSAIAKPAPSTVVTSDSQLMCFTSGRDIRSASAAACAACLWFTVLGEFCQTKSTNLVNDSVVGVVISDDFSDISDGKVVSVTPLIKELYGEDTGQKMKAKSSEPCRCVCVPCVRC